MALAAVPRATPRRVTRSQSREVEDSTTNNVLASKDARQQDDGLGKASSSRLSMVNEESPATSRHTSVSRLGTSMVPESPGNPEGNSNISGTTFLPQDSSFEDGEPDPIIMVEELPDLQSAANRLLDLFVSNASDPRNILDSVKRITNPRNTDSKRLKLAIRKLVSTMNGFSSQAFIDVAQIKQMIPSVQPKGAVQPWSPSPILHRANCARLALDVLLASVGSQSPRQAIERLENQFPAPFLDSIVKRSQSKPVGASTAEKQTFELALEIRTQYFILELEKRQKEKDFDPRSILKGVFYEELALAEEGSAVDPGSLRGFKLKPTFEDENGRLPDRYQDDVIDRISELEYDLFDQDDLPNIQSLKRASWTRFVQRTARFVHSRDKEILSDLQQQPKIDEVEDLVRKEIERRDDHASHETLVWSPSPVPPTDDRSSRALLPREDQPREDQTTPKEPSVNATPPRTRESLVASSRPQASPHNPVDQRSPANRPTQSPAKDPSRRKSIKESRKLFAHSFDVIQRRESRHRQQDMSHLESQHPARPSGAQETSALGTHEPPASAQVDEVPQSPPPRHPEPPESPLFVPQESPLFVPEEESLHLDGLEAEAEATTSPAMRRNNQSNGPFFDSPNGARTQASPPQSTAEIRNVIMGRPPQRLTWTDRQPDAHRISPISESQSAERPRAPAAVPPSSRKRPRPDSDDDDSDNGFDQDIRDINTSERRAQKPPQARPVGKRPRTDHGSESDAADQLQESLTASSQVQLTRTLPFASTQVSTQLAEQQPRSRWLAFNSVSDEQTYPAIEDTRRGRKGWTQAETDRLIMLMARHGTSWAEIKRQDDLCPEQDGGPLLTKRSQVNLKDKARNLKEKFLREGLPLPRNFEGVVGGRKH